jgi:putative FmdB family regulatory protein
LTAASANAAEEGGDVPTYQYACTECGDRTEVVQRFSDDPLTVCTACGGNLRKVFSPVGIVFKGSGFYRTDSRSSSTVPAAKDAATAGSNGSSSDSSAGGSESGKNGSSGSSGDTAAKPAASSSSGGEKKAKAAPAAPAAAS